MRCPVCERPAGAPFLELEAVPVHVNVLHGTREHARATPRGDLRLAFCEGCALVWNVAFDRTLVDYDGFRVHLLDPDGVTLRPIAFNGSRDEYEGQTEEGLTIEGGTGITGRPLMAALLAQLLPWARVRIVRSVDGVYVVRDQALERCARQDRHAPRVVRGQADLGRARRSLADQQPAPQLYLHRPVPRPVKA